MVVREGERRNMPFISSYGNGSKRSYHDTVGFAHSPKVDFLIIATSDEDSARFVPKGQAIDLSSMSDKLLWKERQTETNDNEKSNN